MYPPPPPTHAPVKTFHNPSTTTTITTTWLCTAYYTNLVAVAHEVMDCDEGLEDDDPGLHLCPLDEEVGKLWDGHIGLVGTLQQI